MGKRGLQLTGEHRAALYEAIMNSGLSQAWYAKRLGVDPRLLNSYMTGRNGFSREALRGLWGLLGPVDDLLFIKEEYGLEATEPEQPPPETVASQPVGPAVGQIVDARGHQYPAVLRYALARAAIQWLYVTQDDVEDPQQIMSGLDAIYNASDGAGKLNLVRDLEQCIKDCANSLVANQGTPNDNFP